MATHSSILAWKIPWTEEPGGLVHGITRVRYDLATKQKPGNPFSNVLDFLMASCLHVVPTYLTFVLKTPWWSSGSDSALPTQGAWVGSLVGELESTCHN